MNKDCKKIILNHEIECYEYGRDMYLLSNGLNYYRWIASAKNKFFFLLPDPKIYQIIFLKTFIFLLFSIYILSFFLLLWVNIILSLFICSILYVSLMTRLKKELNFLPKQPLAIIDLEKSTISFFRRNNFPGVQIPQNNLTITCKQIKNLELVSNISVFSGNHEISQIIGHAPFFALYLNYSDNNIEKRTLIFVAIRLKRKVYMPIIELLRLRLEKHIGLNIPS